MSFYDETSRFCRNVPATSSLVPNDRLFTASPRERMGSNHPNFFTQANTRLVEGLELQLSSLVQSHLLSHEAMV